MEAVKVGGETQAYCTSCKTMREHIIVALEDGKPAKVECDECHKQHLFRAGPPGTKKPAKPRAKKSSEPAKNTPSIDLAAHIASRTARGYDVKTGFGLGDVVTHPSFGTGVVTALPGAQKMEVTFEVGSKLLAHDRAAAIAPSLARPARRDDNDGRTVTDAPPNRPARHQTER